MIIDKYNVGRIAERIAMNEFEVRGYHIIDLAYMSKTYANVDFIAAKDGKKYNIQVKGAVNKISKEGDRWWVQYGFCSFGNVDKSCSVFNSKENYALQADFVVLIAVASPSKYRSVILPVDLAEHVAQLNMDGYYRKLGKNGEPRKPGKLWSHLDDAKNPRVKNLENEKIREILLKHEDMWQL